MSGIDWLQYPAIRQTAAYPTVFDKNRFTVQQLKMAAKKGHVLFRGWPFIVYEPEQTHVVQDRLETVINTLGSDNYGFLPNIEQWSLHRSGAFLHKTVMDEAQAPQ